MAYTTNGLTIDVYGVGSWFYTIPDPEGLLSIAYGLQFSTGFPGGLYLDCSFYVPRPLANYWDVRGAYRVVIRNGLKAVYEGKIDHLDGSSDSGGAEGTEVRCTGFWGSVGMRYMIRKRWTDQRITEDIWKYQTDVATYAGAEKCTIDRQNRIRFTPKAVEWSDNDLTAVRLPMPTGQTAKRIKYSYGLAEGGGAWEINVNRSTDASSWTAMTSLSGETYTIGSTTVITADGTGNIDVTLATPSQYLELRFKARATQTPAADGKVYGQFSNIIVYGETGVISAYEIGLDLIGACSELSTSVVGVAGLAGETLPALDQFAFDDFTSIADIAVSAAAYGNTSDESIYFQMRASEEGETNDGKPLLAAGVYPDLTTTNYTVRLSDPNVMSADIDKDFEIIKNWIPVSYTDLNNEQQIITPDDAGYTALTDATSTARYGRRVDPLVSGGYETQTFQNQRRSDRANWRTYGTSVIHNATAALALYYGKRHLARWKNPPWRGSITVVGYINGTGDNKIPASEIEAGKVMDIVDYFTDEILATDTLDYPRVVITATSYDADTETCVISFGPLDDFKMIMAESPYFSSYDTPATGATDTAGGGKGKLNWKRKMGLTPGTPEWDEAVKLGKVKWMEKYGKTKKKKG